MYQASIAKFQCRTSESNFLPQRVICKQILNTFDQPCKMNCHSYSNTCKSVSQVSKKLTVSSIGGCYTPGKVLSILLLFYHEMQCHNCKCRIAASQSNHLYIEYRCHRTEMQLNFFFRIYPKAGCSDMLTQFVTPAWPWPFQLSVHFQGNSCS